MQLCLVHTRGPLQVNRTSRLFGYSRRLSNLRSNADYSTAQQNCCDARAFKIENVFVQFAMIALLACRCFRDEGRRLCRVPRRMVRHLVGLVTVQLSVFGGSEPAQRCGHVREESQWQSQSQESQSHSLPQSQWQTPLSDAYLIARIIDDTTEKRSESLDPFHTRR